MKLFEQIKHFFSLNKNKEKKATLQQEQEQKIVVDIYADYPEMPFIHPERDLQEWLEAAKNDSSLIVPKENMIRDDIGLLPGDIYLLYWLFRHKNQVFPSYFESFFGININKSLQELSNRNFIDDKLRPTKLGCEQIDDYAIYLNNMKQYIQKNFPNEIS